MAIQEKYFEEYYKKNRELILLKRKKYYTKKKEEININHKEYYKNNTEKLLLQKKQYHNSHKKERRLYILKKVYNLTENEYEEIKQRQNGKCAICERPFGEIKECVDHDHKTGRVRGILCDGCNSAIGRLKDDYTLVSAAKEYLLINSFGLRIIGSA